MSTTLHPSQGAGAAATQQGMSCSAGWHVTFCIVCYKLPRFASPGAPEGPAPPMLCAALCPCAVPVLPCSLPCRHDVDLLVELNVRDPTRGAFESCRTDCLNTICTVLGLCTGLCTPAAAGSGGGSEQQLAQAGWQVDSHVSHWLRLQHPVLGLQLDIKVSLASAEGA